MQINFKNNFKFCHINSQSLKAHINYARSIFQQGLFDVIGVSESWLKSKDKNAVIRINDYNIIRNDRRRKRGGGVLLFIKKNIKYKVLMRSPSLYENKPEYIIVSLMFNNTRVLFAVVYRPPNAQYFGQFITDMSQFISNHDQYFVVGDININLADSSTARDKFDQMLYDLDMKCLNIPNTYHHSPLHNSTIDVIAYKNEDNIDNFVSYGKIEVPDISNHELLYAVYPIIVPKMKPKLITYRDYSNFDESKLVEDAYKIKWHEISDLNCIHEKTEKLSNFILELFNKHAPLKTKTILKPCSPWITKEIKGIHA